MFEAMFWKGDRWEVKAYFPYKDDAIEYVKWSCRRYNYVRGVVELNHEWVYDTETLAEEL